MDSPGQFRSPGTNREITREPGRINHHTGERAGEARDSSWRGRRQAGRGGRQAGSSLTVGVGAAQVQSGNVGEPHLILQLAAGNSQVPGNFLNQA